MMWPTEWTTVHFVIPDGYQGIFKLEPRRGSASVRRQGQAYLPDSGLQRAHGRDAVHGAVDGVWWGLMHGVR
jgi:hypothetical protein